MVLLGNITMESACLLAGWYIQVMAGAAAAILDGEMTFGIEAKYEEVR